MYIQYVAEVHYMYTCGRTTSCKCKIHLVDIHSMYRSRQMNICTIYACKDHMQKYTGTDIT